VSVKADDAVGIVQLSLRGFKKVPPSIETHLEPLNGVLDRPTAEIDSVVKPGRLIWREYVSELRKEPLHARGGVLRDFRIGESVADLLHHWSPWQRQI
jgi:hypothetical protein